MRAAFVLGAAVTVVVLATAESPAGADLIGSPVGIDVVAVFNPGNAPDATGYGAVNYYYYIARTEITVAQYTQFLNAVAKSDAKGLYNATVDSYLQIIRTGAPGSYSYAPASGMTNFPVARVNWYDAARFVNWLHNGQPTGAQGVSTTERGAYDLTVSGPPVRQANAQWALPSIDEWYKAAYYDPTLNDAAGGYWLYPTRSDAAPSSQAPPGGDNSANYEGPGGYVVGVPRYTNVGAYLDSLSYYGTVDQGGNVGEWTEELSLGTFRTIRGGSWDSSAGALSSLVGGASDPNNHYRDIGFRVIFMPIQAEVPEPATLGLLAAGGLLVGAVRLRRRR